MLPSMVLFADFCDHSVLAVMVIPEQSGGEHAGLE